MPSCKFCNGEHFPRECRKYATAQHRCLQAFTLGLCKRCLCPGHEAAACSYRKQCYYCGGDHHQTMCLKKFDSGKGMPSCIFCSGDHLNAKCSLHDSAKVRRRIIKAKELCKQCFGSLARHGKQCARPMACAHCEGKHNSALCKSFKRSDSSRAQLTSPSSTRSDRHEQHTTTPIEPNTEIEGLLTQKEQLEKFEALLAERKAALCKEREGLEKEKKLVQQEKEKVKMDKREVEAERHGIAQEKSKMDAESAELDVLKRSVEYGRGALQEQLESLKREDSAELRRAKEQVMSLEEELATALATIESLQKRCGEQAADLGNARAQVREQFERRRSLREELSRVEKELSDVKSAKNNLLAEGSPDPVAQRRSYPFDNFSEPAEPKKTRLE